VNDATNKVSFDNPYQVARNRLIVELQKELVRIGFAEAIEAL
jgi:hypothetical protein